MLKRRLLVAVFGIALTAILSSAAVAEPVKNDPANLDVVMYATQSCPYCVRARDYFTRHGVAWDERDIEQSSTARAEWKAKGGVGTPMIVINDKVFQGFTQKWLDLELAKYGK